MRYYYIFDHALFKGGNSIEWSEVRLLLQIDIAYQGNIGEIVSLASNASMATQFILHTARYSTTQRIRALPCMIRSAS